MCWQVCSKMQRQPSSPMYASTSSLAPIPSCPPPSSTSWVKYQQHTQRSEQTLCSLVFICCLQTYLKYALFHPFLLQIIQSAFETLSNAFLIFPQFNFGNGLMYLARVNIEVQILSGYGIDAYKNPFSTDGLGWMFISSFIIGLFFFTLRLLLNKTLIRKVW